MADHCPPIWNPRTSNSGDGFIPQCTPRSKKRNCKHHRDELGQSWINIDADWVRLGAPVEDDHGQWVQALVSGDRTTVQVARVDKHEGFVRNSLFSDTVPAGPVEKRENWIGQWCKRFLERATTPQPPETPTAEDIIEAIWLARRGA